GHSDRGRSHEQVNDPLRHLSPTGVRTKPTWTRDGGGPSVGDGDSQPPGTLTPEHKKRGRPPPILLAGADPSFSPTASRAQPPGTPPTPGRWRPGDPGDGSGCRVPQHHFQSRAPPRSRHHCRCCSWTCSTQWSSSEGSLYLFHASP